jgi:transcriptional regulator with XRE-family HTH domain
MDHLWVKDALAQAGYMQRDLAQVWGVSEGAVSRWMHGFERQDLPISRARALSRMINMPLDELVDRLGFGETELPPPAPMVAGSAPKLGTQSWSMTDERCTILLHIDVPRKVGNQIIKLITADSDSI